MTTFRNAWAIIRGDFRADKLMLLRALVFSVIFMGYMSFLNGLIANDVLDSGDGKLINDYLMLISIPLLGFIFSKRTMKYLSEDSYTRMLAYMRGLPIPSVVILCKRKLQAVFSFCLNGILYFGIMYVASGNIRNELPAAAYLAFAITWVGYGLIVNGLYIFIEYSVSGKMYFLLTMIIVLLCLGAASLIYLTGGNLFLYSLDYSKKWEFLSPLMWGTLLMGTLSVQLFSKWTIYRLKSRDLV